MSKEKKQTPQQAFNQFLFEEMTERLTDVKAYEKEVAGFSKQISQHITYHEENEVQLTKFYAELIAKVEALEANLDSHAHTGLMQRITKLERVHKWESSGLVALSKVEAMDQNLAAHHERMNRHDTRISDHDESIEALSETVDQLPSRHTCHNLAALEEDRARIIKLEQENIDQREDYHSHIRQLVTENEAAHKRFVQSQQEQNTILSTLQLQMKNLTSEHSQIAADTNKAIFTLKQIVPKLNGVCNKVIEMEQKGCSDCKYWKTKAFNPPCSGCIHGNGNDEKWEAKPTGRPKKE